MPSPDPHRRRWSAAVAAILVTASACAPAPASTAALSSCHAPLTMPARILVFSRTSGYRHGSIEAGVAAVRQLGTALGFGVDHTEDPVAFEPDRLGPYRAVMFLNTTQDVLAPSQQAALEAFVLGGGGFVGVHAAADTEYEWPWYGQLVGAWFKSHPAIQEAVLARRDSTHPSTRCLPASWRRTDEWYDFRSLPPAAATILLSIDERSYQGGAMGEFHPMAWAQQVGGGRAWYTALGHTVASYREPAFLDHLAGGILWVIGQGVEGTRE